MRKSCKSCVWFQGTVQMDQSGSVRFANPLYDKPAPVEGKEKEPIPAHSYVTSGDVNLNVAKESNE